MTSATKNDTLVLRNGDRMTGEFKQLQRGLVMLKTDAASTIYVKWTRVVTATTDKRFEIHLEDGRVFVGSIAASQTAYRVIVRGRTDTVEVAVRSVVEMARIKKTFWDRLDGSVDLGVNFTQQNAKFDLNLATTVTYQVAANRVGLLFNGTFSRQDSTEDINRRNLTGLYAREFNNQWFWAAAGSADRNSQLSLDYAWSLGTGPGRFLILSNKVNLGSWIGLNYRREKYVGDDARSTIPVSLATDFQWFSWSGLSTDISSRLVISPIVNDSGRWQINFTASIKQEVLNQLYLTVGITEFYDSKPPTQTNKNDFSITTSLGWTF